ncbi:unnamed protein product [Sphagnum balticum]
MKKGYERLLVVAQVQTAEQCVQRTALEAYHTNELGLGGGVTREVLRRMECPIEHTRIRIQIQRGSTDKVYSGSLDAALQIFKKHGFRGLNRGQGPTTVRESTGLCLYFTVIEKLTELLSLPGVKKEDQPLYVPLLAGGVGGTFYWVFNYPFDYVKTLMQSDKFGDFRYKSMAQCFS